MKLVVLETTICLYERLRLLVNSITWGLNSMNNSTSTA